MNILVTGGAGYIGSFMVKRLLADGHEVTVIDSFERGHREIENEHVTYQKGDLIDKDFLASILTKQQFDGIIHFAGYISVGESMQNAYQYFHNNISGSLELLEQARIHNNTKIIFSSSAAVYGNPVQNPIPEGHQKHPESIYGETKWMFETILKWYYQVHQVNSVSLRYFNACGAALDGSMGEAHMPETHIIPNAIKAILNESEFKLFGTDYHTPDGTCVRDYIHVLDLVEAHILALKKIEKDNGAFAYNVGTGKGYSNKEVLEMIEKVSEKKLTIVTEERRPGDADTLVADAQNIQKEIGFAPQYSDLETIIKSAWAWHTQSEKINEN